MRRLETLAVEKPWGRHDLPAMFGGKNARRIGEIWFAPPGGEELPLLVKYLFTSEALSVQVHPNDAQARQAGLRGGKSECWLVLDADPHAVIGIGLRELATADALRAAAADGSIERMLDWVPVAVGDFFYIPAGTVHAIGAGVSLIEVQQNNDVTYRLYDYGRDRPLHLDEGIPVSRLGPYAVLPGASENDGTTLLVEGDGQPFRLERIRRAEGRIDLPVGPCWFIPLMGSGRIDDAPWIKGECWFGEEGGTIEFAEPSDILVARC